MSQPGSPRDEKEGEAPSLLFPFERLLFFPLCLLSCPDNAGLLDIKVDNLLLHLALSWHP